MNLCLQVSIKQINRVGAYPSTDIEVSEQEVTVTSGGATVFEYNQTVAESGRGFQGWRINPRNLTLWINSTGHRDMAIAQLGWNVVANLHLGNKTCILWDSIKYRVTQQILDLGWVDFYFGCPPVCPILLGLIEMGRMG